MRVWQLTAAAIVAALAQHAATATEPNETFATSTIFSPGVLMVSDQLTPGTVESAPDTLLGLRNASGSVYFIDDNSSVAGNGTASGAFTKSTNSGGISFSISGVGDNSFIGNHTQSGLYEVFVDVYDASEERIAELYQLRTMQPGVPSNFSFDNPDWIGGTYDVYIDNEVPMGGDVDFFTFTGLPVGQSFTAETFDPSAMGVDTRLGWIGVGGLLAENDDQDVDIKTSKLQGIVQPGGQLTFAVTGFNDVTYSGLHMVEGEYELRLTLGGSGILTADFNGDTIVNGADLATWRGNFGPSGVADADGDNDSDGRDFLIWQRELGRSAAVPAGGVAVSAVPEPASGGFFVSAASVVGWAAVRVSARRRN